MDADRKINELKITINARQPYVVDIPYTAGIEHGDDAKEKHHIAASAAGFAVLLNIVGNRVSFT